MEVVGKRVSPKLAEAVYREYMTFFEKAERNRRWSIFDDVPWEELRAEPHLPELAIVAETFCAVEMYLPDYISQGLQAVRDSSYGQAWFMANWGYEESKHSLALREWLVRGGYRTPADLHEMDNQIFAQKWDRPFDSARQMTMYAAIQEMATFVIYRKQRKRAADGGEPVLARIFQLIQRDEAAHARFYMDVMKLYKAEDPVGFVDDLAHVFRHFKMPGVGLVPNYEERVETMRAGGIDRGVFIDEVWLPVAKRVGFTRRDLAAAASRRNNRERVAGARASQQGAPPVG